MSEPSGDSIRSYLQLAGIESSDPNYGEQYNLMHASLGELGIRAGLDLRAQKVLLDRGLGNGTLEGMMRFYEAVLRIILREIANAGAGDS